MHLWWPCRDMLLSMNKPSYIAWRLWISFLEYVQDDWTSTDIWIQFFPRFWIRHSHAFFPTNPFYIFNSTWMWLIALTSLWGKDEQCCDLLKGYITLWVIFYCAQSYTELYRCFYSIWQVITAAFALKNTIFKYTLKGFQVFFCQSLQCNQGFAEVEWHFLNQTPLSSAAEEKPVKLTNQECTVADIFPGLFSLHFIKSMKCHIKPEHWQTFKGALCKIL